MMTPKSISRMYALKNKKKSGRTLAEENEYKRLDLKWQTQQFDIEDLQWKAQLAEAVLNAICVNEFDVDTLNKIIEKMVNKTAKPLKRKDLLDFVNNYVKENSVLQPLTHKKRVEISSEKTDDVSNLIPNFEHRNHGQN